MDFSISPRQVSVAPSDIADLRFEDGAAIVVFADRSQVRAYLGHLIDAKIFLAVLSVLRGKSPQVGGAGPNEMRGSIEDRRPVAEARNR